MSNRLMKQLAFVAVVAVLVAACTGGTDSTTTTSAPTDETTTGSGGDGGVEVSLTTPEASGEIDSVTWNLPRGGPTSLDPARAFGSQNAPVVSNLCDSLLRSTLEGVPEPGVAESYDHPDPLTYVFTLRDGVTFWDGSAVTAEDVAFSIERSATLATSAWQGALQNFASAEATDDSTVTVTLSEPNELFPKVVAGGAGVVISKSFTEAAGENFGTAVDQLQCTGPFELSAWEQGTSVTIARNDGYWDSARMPKAGEITFRFITDASTLTQALQNGEVDGTYFAPYASLEQLKDSDAGTLYFGPPNTTGVLFIFRDTAGTSLADPRIRQALRTALDYDGILNGIFKGAGQLLSATAPPSDWSYSRDIFQAGWDALPAPVQDLDAAKALVEEAGVPSEPITCAAPALTEEFIQICIAVQAAAQAIGLEADVATVPQSEYGAISQRANEDLRTEYDMNFAQVPLYLTDPVDLYNNEASPGGQWNLMGYSNDQVTADLAEAVQTEDDDARAKLVVAAQAQIMEDLPWIPVMGAYQTLFMSNRITGAALNVAQWYPWAVGIGSAG